MGTIGLMQAQLDADLAALDACEARHAVQTLVDHGSRGNAARRGEREGIAMVTSGGVRIPAGFGCAATLAGGTVLTCSRCAWTAEMRPCGLGFEVTLSDRKGRYDFGGRGRAAVAVEGAAVQHGEACGKA